MPVHETPPRLEISLLVCIAAGMHLRLPCPWQSKIPHALCP
uniref:Uncharacterized protein n=1 Tax=Rhizophora mucronata TaxID=61149 RepID=A0A2P2NDB1_RHIMU